MADDKANDKVTDNEDSEVVVKKEKSGGIMKMVLIILLILILVAISIGATLYFAGVFDKHDDMLQDDETHNTDSKKVEKKEVIRRDSIYYPFDPVFVVNFSDGKSIRYLQLSIEIMTYDEDVLEDVEKHMPVIRNNLIMMFSNLNYEVINSVAGKRKLQNEALTEIKSILLDKTGREGVEEVYFTGFVMQ